MPAKVVCPSCHISLDAPDELLGQAVKCEECGSTFTARAAARPRSESAADTKARPRRRDDDEDDYDRRPRRSSRRDDDEDDDLPRRRPVRKARGSGALPFVLAGGGLVLFVFVAVGVGLYFLFSGSSKKADPQAFAPVPNNPGGFAPLPPAANPVQPAAPLPNNPPPVQPAAPPNPGNPPPAAGAQKVKLSNPRWSFGGGLGGDFEVDYELTAGRPVGGLWALKWRYADGTSGSANLHMSPFDGARGTWKINVIGGGMARGRRGGGMEIWVEEGGIGRIAGNKVSNSVTLN